MVTAAFDFRTIRLREYGGDLVLVQTAYFRFGRLFSRDPQYLTTLPRRQGLAVSDEGEETTQHEIAAAIGLALQGEVDWALPIIFLEA
jgi:hypothetical protein